MKQFLCTLVSVAVLSGCQSLSYQATQTLPRKDTMIAQKSTPSIKTSSKLQQRKSDAMIFGVKADIWRALDRDTKQRIIAIYNKTEELKFSNKGVA